MHTFKFHVRAHHLSNWSIALVGWSKSILPYSIHPRSKVQRGDRLLIFPSHLHRSCTRRATGILCHLWRRSRAHLALLLPLACIFSSFFAALIPCSQCSCSSSCTRSWRCCMTKKKLINASKKCRSYQCTFALIRWLDPMTWLPPTVFVPCVFLKPQWYTSTKRNWILHSEIKKLLLTRATAF